MPGLHSPGCGCKDESQLSSGEFLYKFVDKDSVRALNEQEEGSAKNTIKIYEDRLDEEKSCRSVCGDCELMIYIPFVSPCKVASLLLIGGCSGRHPSKVEVYANHEDLDFTNVNDVKCIQEIELTEDFHGSVEYPLRVTKLQNVMSLTLYFPTNFGGEYTELFYIGLRGQATCYSMKVVQTVYEARPNVKDHKIFGDKSTPQLGI